MKHDGGAILVVDDSPTVRRLSELILTQQGYAVYTAEDGEKGLDLARKIVPMAILVDFVMPKMNGQQFCRAVRTDKAMQDIPLILISSKGEAIGQAFEEQFGVLHYFTKPFEPEELVRKLEEVLSTRPLSLSTSNDSDPGPLAADDKMKTLEERFDKIIRQYFHHEFPILAKNIFSDTLYETGLAQKQSLILSGNLAHIPLPDVINFTYNSRLSGRLTVFSNDIFGEIFIEDGHFVFASISKKGPSHQFLTDLIEADGRVAVDRQTMAEVIEEARNRNVPVGRILVQKRLISNHDLMGYLQRHSQDAFNGILEAKDGQFFLEKDELPLNLQDISFRVPLISVLMEGLRRQDEKQQAAVTFRDEHIVLIRLITNEEALETYQFTETELKVFSMVDGKKTLGVLIEESDLDPLEIRRICYSLNKVNLLRVKN